MTFKTQPFDRSELSGDPHRPGFHFLPPRHWLNDPNGFIQYHGRYHVFYQHNPYGPLWDTMHWGHALSDDLIHWSDRGVALEPTPDSPDEDGCWSGCAVLDAQGLPTLIYTGLRQGQYLPCLATSPDPNLDTWQKYSANPIMAAPPPELNLVGFRDHSVWREGDTWYQLIGSGIKGVGGCVLLYHSKDLRNWEYLHPLLIGDREATGEMWECPDFFRLGDKYVLLISVMPLERVLYFVGDYSGHSFEPTYQGVLDYGIFYAPQTIRDERGRRIMLGWLREERSDEALKKAGWAGAMSVPRVLDLQADFQLKVTPLAELSTLRDKYYQWASGVLETGQTLPLTTLPATMLEIIAEFEVGEATSFSLNLNWAENDTQETRVVIDTFNQSLRLEREWADANPHHYHYPHTARLKLAKAEGSVKLHILLDRSIIEIFANDTTSLSARLYPSFSKSGSDTSLSLSCQRGAVKFVSLEVWTLQV